MKVRMLELCTHVIIETKTEICELSGYYLLFSVLSDEHSRAIYDIFGKKGLEVEGWEVFILSIITSYT